jgi:hypothetical protein
MMRALLRFTNNHKQICGVLLLGSSMAQAQWPDHPTPNVPLTAAGEPDYLAATPRTADGHPDFSGLWELWTRSAPGRQAAEAATATTAATTPATTAAADTPPLGTFFDLGANIEGGLPYLPAAKALRDERQANDSRDNPDAHCLPMGFTQLHLHPQPHKIVQLPHLIVIMWEGNSGLRQIFLDGRSLPDNDPQPWWYGYSVGRWEGDTLVVETNGLLDGGWLDVNGSPLSDKARVTERFERPQYGKMTVDVTIDDPVNYSQPFTVRIEHGAMLNTELIEFICQENEQSTQFFDQP